MTILWSGVKKKKKVRWGGGGGYRVGLEDNATTLVKFVNNQDVITS